MLLLVGSSVGEGIIAVLRRFNDALDLFIDGKDDCLTWSNSSDSRCDTFPECTETFLSKHVPCYICNSRKGRFTFDARRSLDSGLDGVNRGVGEGTQCTRDEANECCLIRWKLSRSLKFGSCLFELLVRSKVGSWGQEGNRVNL